MKVLVIDADPSTRLMVKRVLIRDFECTVLEAENGLDGLEALEKQSFSLVILDLTLPLLNGERVLGIIRQTADATSLPIVVSTDNPDPERIRHVLQFGVSDCIVKPYDTATFSGRLGRILRRAGESRPGPLNAIGLSSRPQLGAMPTVLVVDGDKDFRHLVTSALSGRALVKQASTGTEALRTCLQTAPALIMIGQNLGLLKHEVLVAELRRAKTLEQTQIIGVAPKNLVPAVKAAAPYDGVVARTYLPNALFSQIAHLFPSTGPLASLLEAFPTLRTSMISAVELVSGLMLGLEMNPVDAAPEPSSAPEAVATVDIKPATSADSISMELGCSVDVGRLIAAKMVQADPGDLSDDDARETLAELANMVSGRLKSGLEERAIPITCGLPKTAIRSGDTSPPPADSLTCFFAVEEHDAAFRVTLRNAA